MKMILLNLLWKVYFSFLDILVSYVTLLPAEKLGSSFGTTTRTYKYPVPVRRERYLVVQLTSCTCGAVCSSRIG